MAIEEVCEHINYEERNKIATTLRLGNQLKKHGLLVSIATNASHDFFILLDFLKLVLYNFYKKVINL